MTQSCIARHYVVEGRVQGVGFRWWTRKVASSLGIGGWAMNRPDGTVEVLAIGDPGQLDELEERLHEGPMAAEVTRVVVSERGPRRAAGEFEIRFEQA